MRELGHVESVCFETDYNKMMEIREYIDEKGG